MTPCINPDCRFVNPDNVLFCQNCGSELLLQGRYQVIRLLSNQGGFADTYEVNHQGVPKILKVLKDWEFKEKDNRKKSIELFEREFQVLSQSNHPGIPKAEDYFQYIPKNGQTPLYCLVMEKFAGDDLKEYINKLGKPIDEKTALVYLEQLVHILKEVHNQGLIHRDIKPSNIILKSNGQLALIDFGGVGKFSNNIQNQAGNTCIRSINYTAEEQIRGCAVPQSDFFSLGRTFVYLLTATDLTDLNYTKENLLDWHRFVPSISPQVIRFIDQMMAPSVEERPTNADEILGQLNGFKQTLVSAIHVSETPIEIEAKTMSKNGKYTNLSIFLGSLVFFLLSGGAIYQILESRKTSLLADSKASVSPLTASTSVDPDNKVAASPKCSATNLVRKSGNLYGVIEVGSKGIKGEVIQELETANEEGFKFIVREEEIEERNANSVDPKAQTESINAVKGMFAEIQQRFGIPCEQIVIYGSSGVSQKAPHKDILAKEIQQETDRAMEFISPEQEANFVFNGVVPQWRLKDVMTLDIGSGNTKGAYQKTTKKGDNVTFSIPFGTRTFTEEISKNQGSTDFTKAAESTKNKILIPQIRDEVQRKPGMQNIPVVYLSGGISWALSTLVRPCGREQAIPNIRDERVARYARISSEDINTFYNNATRDQKTLFEPDLSQCSAERKEKVQKDIERIKTDVFSKDNLIAGAEILRAFSSELKFSEKRGMFFARYAIEALPVGYLMEQLESAEENVTK